METAFVFAFFGMSTVFMLLVLVSLLRESLRPNNRGKDLRPTTLDWPIWSDVTSHIKQDLE